LKTRRFLLIFSVACLFFASGLFLWRLTHTVESELSVPVVIKNLSQDLIIVSQPPKEVDTVVAGQKMVVEAFMEQTHTYVLDLAGATAGLVTLPVEESNLQFPGSISVIEMTPASFTLRIEPKLAKTVPLMVRLADSPAPGYRVALTLASPSSLQIVGPAKDLALIDKLYTLPISIENASEPFKREIAVDLPSGVSIGGSGKSLVTAQVNIEENVVVKRFENIPVKGRNTDFPVRITPPDIDIDVRGSEIDLSRLSAGDAISVYVDLKDLSPGVYVRRAQITLPVGTTLVAANPEVFTVAIGN
jgi:YbbR domain-containing protein